MEMRLLCPGFGRGLWLCLPVAVEAAQQVAPKKEVGIDLGLHPSPPRAMGEAAVTSFYRTSRRKLPRSAPGHKRQANACTALPQGGARRPYTDSQQSLLGNTRTSSSAM